MIFGAFHKLIKFHSKIHKEINYLFYHNMLNVRKWVKFTKYNRFFIKKIASIRMNNANVIISLITTKKKQKEIISNLFCV